MFKKWCQAERWCQACAAALLFVLCSNTGAADLATQPPKGAIVVATNNWASQVVGANVIKALLERSGHTVVLKSVSVDFQLAALGEGELHVQGEMRESVMGESLDKAVRSKRVLRAGNHDAMSREGWWYPEYVQPMCPGLPRWEQLNVCASVFEDPATRPLARFLAGPKVWKHRDQERAEALNLRFKVVNAESPAALLDELEESWAARRPILMFRWSPHWMDLRYPGRFVEFPEYDPNCVTDPSWGPNPNAIYDCDLYKASAISKAVWAQLPKQQPCAFNLIKRVTFTGRDLAVMEEMVALRKLTPEEAAGQWLRDYEPRWRRWIPRCRAAK